MMPTAVVALADEVERRLQASGIALTMGGEPTYVPEDCSGAEWNVTAVGPTKLRYARALARTLQSDVIPGAIAMFSPGKLYPGETNPRWVVNLLWSPDEALAPTPGRGRKPTARSLAVLRDAVTMRLGLPPDRWVRAIDSLAPRRPVWVLPLDHHGERGWQTDDWYGGKRRPLRLLVADGPSGLRLPLNLLPPEAMRRALVLEIRDGAITCFLPPLLHAPFRELLAILISELSAHGLGSAERHQFEGYLPIDLDPRWGRLGLTADPGVLEVNLPPCNTWHEYNRWLAVIELAANKVGLRSWKPDALRGVQAGTGGGNHLLFGGPSIETNPFFNRPAWIASILRYFQAHPCLAYLFTGSYVGPSSQAPRPDESGRGFHDLELAYALLEAHKAGDHRVLIGETLRHLHTDMAGNTHRSEISFDKFWDIGAGTGWGLIEFRAIESMPHAEWMSMAALLWRAILLHTYEVARTAPLTAFGAPLHDRFFLPTQLWADLESILADLQNAALNIDKSGRAILRAIWEWRFPVLLEVEAVIVRRACEHWPLLCETPLEGGSTSRFVDTSIDRLEISAPAEMASTLAVFVNGRPARLLQLSDELAGFGLRYRLSALYPSLHPGIPPQVPLRLEIRAGGRSLRFQLPADQTKFVVDDSAASESAGTPCRAAEEGLLTYDLRL